MWFYKQEVLNELLGNLLLKLNALFVLLELRGEVAQAVLLLTLQHLFQRFENVRVLVTQGVFKSTIVEAGLRQLALLGIEFVAQLPGER